MQLLADQVEQMKFNTAIYYQFYYIDMCEFEQILMLVWLQ